MVIDTFYDFTSELPSYWEGFWDQDNILCEGGCDPDKDSPTLQEYHRLLWSKPLPNGEVMELKKGEDAYTYLTWKDMRFGSDSIIATFRYKRYQRILEQAMERLIDYKSYYENLLRMAYTIGGAIIFPKHMRNINQNRGTNKLISDRWDLTLECIRRYYAGEESPLSATIERDKAFFDLFVDFKGYVDFFLLQDCVSDDYSSVDIWYGDTSFKKSGLPETVDDYFAYLREEFEFLNKRNYRILKLSDPIERERVDETWGKRRAVDQIWWLETPHQKGVMAFSFDKKRRYNMWTDYPSALTPREKEIFDEENPFWADFFKDKGKK